MGDALHNKYFWEYVNGMGRPTTAYRWAWHAYEDGVASQEPGLARLPSARWGRLKHFREAIDQVMKNAKCAACKTPDIWLTEQGVKYFLENQAQSVPLTKPKKPKEKVKGTVIFTHPVLARKIMNAYVDDGRNSITRQPQVKRFFYYQVLGDPVQWDSGLLEARTAIPLKPEPRPAKETPREIYRAYREKTLLGG